MAHNKSTGRPGIVLLVWAIFCLTGCQTEIEKTVEQAEALYQQNKVVEAIDLLAPQQLDQLKDKPSEKVTETRIKANQLRAEWTIKRAAAMRDEGDFLEANELLLGVRQDYGDSPALRQQALFGLLAGSQSAEDELKRYNILTLALDWDPNDLLALAAAAQVTVNLERWESAREYLQRFDAQARANDAPQEAAKMRPLIDTLKEQLATYDDQARYLRLVDDFNKRVVSVRKYLDQKPDEECRDPDAIKTQFEHLAVIPPRTDAGRIGIKVIPIYREAVALMTQLEHERQSLSSCHTDQHRNNVAKVRQAYVQRLFDRLAGTHNIIEVYAEGKYKDQLVIKRAVNTDYYWAQAFNAAAKRSDGLYSDLKLFGFRAVWIANPWGDQGKLTSIVY